MQPFIYKVVCILDNWEDIETLYTDSYKTALILKKELEEKYIDESEGTYIKEVKLEERF